MLSETPRSSAPRRQPPLSSLLLLQRFARAVAHAGIKRGLLLAIVLLAGFSSGRAFAATDTLLVTTSAAQPIVAGTSINVTVTAMNGAAVDAAYTGSIAVTTNDAQSVAVPDVTIGAGDMGTKTFSIVLKTAGSTRITTTDKVTAAITGSLSVTVADSGVAVSLQLSAYPVTAVSGTQFPVTITVKDAFANTVVGYTGPVIVNSTDTTMNTRVVASHTFVAMDQGVATVNVTLLKAGTYILTATDGVNTGVSTTITVIASAAVGLVFTGVPVTVTAGAPFSFTLKAVDAAGNTVTRYLGTPTVLTTDPKTPHGPTHRFTVADAGTFTYSTRVMTKGRQQLYASDPAQSGLTAALSTDVVVAAAPLAQLILVGTPSSTASGQVFSFSVFPADAFGNQVNGYTGTVHFTSSDSAATLPADVTFGPNASTLVQAALATIGTFSISATDTINGALTGSSPDIIVAANPLVAASVDPAVLVGGKSTSLTLTLAYAVNTSTIVLVYFDSAAIDPLTVTIPAGQTSATVPLPTRAVDFATDATLTATANGASLTTNVTLTPFIPFDFNGDGNVDLLLQSQSNGAVYFVPFRNVYQQGFSTILAGGSTNFRVVGSPDLNGDFNNDLLFEDPLSRDVAYLYLDGPIPLYNPSTPNHLYNDYLFRGIPAGFVIVGTPDLNRDHHPDILFEDPSTGDSAYNLMNGLTTLSGGYLFRNFNTDYHIVGTPDINGDRYPDILWQSKTTGKVIYQLMNGVTPIANGSGTLFETVQAGYELVGTPDLNGDGKPDLVFQNLATGSVSYVLMNGVTPIGSGFLLTGLNSDLKVVGIH